MFFPKILHQYFNDENIEINYNFAENLNIITMRAQKFSHPFSFFFSLYNDRFIILVERIHKLPLNFTGIYNKDVLLRF